MNEVRMRGGLRPMELSAGGIYANLASSGKRFASLQANLSES